MAQQVRIESFPIHTGRQRSTRQRRRRSEGRKRPGRTRLLSAPNNGEFSNETYFVTSDNAEEQMRVYRGLIEFGRQAITGFVLMSDGPENALYHNATRIMAPACSKLLRSCRALHENEMSLRLQETLENVIARKTNDDCSLAPSPGAASTASTEGS